MGESYASGEAGDEVSGESSEVIQPLTRLSSVGTAACRLEEAFGGEALAAAMEQKSEPQHWQDGLHLGENGLLYCTAADSRGSEACITCWVLISGRRIDPGLQNLNQAPPVHAEPMQGSPFVGTNNCTSTRFPGS